MYHAEIFLTIGDLMRLYNSTSYNHVAKRYKSIRDRLGIKNRNLTIREFCKYENFQFAEIWCFLRSSPPPQLRNG